MAKSFVMVLSRRYRAYVNAQTGYWFVRYRDGNSRRRFSLGVKTRPEAEDSIQKLDRPVEGPKHEICRLLWKEFQMAYLTYKETQGKAPSTVSRYKTALAAFGRHLEKESVRFVDQIALPNLESYISYRTNKEKCDCKTAYNDALVIKNALKWGSKPARGHLKSNPALDWETTEPIKPKRRTYTQAEVNKLEAEAQSWLRPIVTTLAYSGMRIGELIALRWQDVDLTKRVINIRIREDWRPKGKTDRTVPMHGKVEAAIRQQPLGQFVFSGRNGKPMRESCTLKWLHRDQSRLGLPKNDLHGFRRFFATTMLKAGVSVDTVRQWGGWKSLETMLRYLAETTVEESVKEMEAVTRKLSAS